MPNITMSDIIQLCCIIFFAGAFWAELKAIRKDINRLEEKQDHYNTLQERTLKLEVWQRYHAKEHEACQSLATQAKKD